MRLKLRKIRICRDEYEYNIKNIGVNYMRVMIDTNIFDKIVNDFETIDTAISDGKLEVFFTSIQKREIEEIRDEKKREQLTNLMKKWEANVIPTSFSFRHIDFAHFSFASGEIMSEIERGNVKNHFDALIADAAFAEGLSLITNDKRLIKHSIGKINVMDYDTFITLVKTMLQEGI